MIESARTCLSKVVDLTDAVTVFVTTVGARTYEACLEHLRQQDSRFVLRVIDRVAPMNAAFQIMADECRTPYYVQVDEDMLLFPHAVRTLYERIDAAGGTTAMFIANLYDEHLERCILGVKIYRHSIVSRYPFAGMDRFESEQVARLHADGYAVVRTKAEVEPTEGETLGLHGTAWTPESIYERYFSLERRRQTHPPQIGWFAAYGPEFLRRFLADPTEENFYALMGVIAGKLASLDGPAEAKDFRTYGELPGFAEVRRFFEAFSTERHLDTSAVSKNGTR